MAHTLERFAAECRKILSVDPGADGVEKVRRLLQEVLADEEFIERYLGHDTESERDVLYEDPELGFCIVTHVDKGASVGTPHDHGDSWAIYGQAIGVTRMTEWRVVEPPNGDEPGKAEAVRSFDHLPGTASVWHVGVMHSPSHEGESRLIRIKGRNLGGVTRDRYEPA